MIVDLKECESIIRSAVANPKAPPLGSFEELREMAVKENKFSKEKVAYEDEKYQVIFKITWDKDKLLFLYEDKVFDKRSGERVIGTDEGHGNVPGFHGKRHLHSGKYTSSIPTVLIDKIQHPILSLIINSMPKNKQEKWIKKLANELKDSFDEWDKDQSWHVKKRG